MTSGDTGPRSGDPGPIETGPVTKRGPGWGLTIGRIQGTNVAIGHNASASAAPDDLSLAQQNVVALLDTFIRQLEQCENSVMDLADIRDLAEAARGEMSKPTPRRPVVRRMLEGVAAGVADDSALTEAINTIRALVEHLL